MSAATRSRAAQSNRTADAVPSSGGSTRREKPQHWNRPVAVSVTAPNGEPLSLPAPGVEIEYRGLWQVFDDQVYTSKIRQAEAETALQHVISERDLLRFANDELTIKFKETLASLTESSSSHMEAQQILQQIRAEKEKLVSRISALESHQSWLEQQHRKMQDNLQFWQAKNASTEADNARMQQTVAEMTKRCETLENLAKAKDEQLSLAARALQSLQQDHAVLEKSRVTKDRLYQHALKERDALKAQVEEMAKQLNQPRRRAAELLPQDPGVRHPTTPLKSVKKIAQSVRASVEEVEVVESPLPEVSITPAAVFVAPTPKATPDLLTGDVYTPDVYRPALLTATSVASPSCGAQGGQAAIKNPWAADSPLQLAPRTLDLSPSPSTSVSPAVRSVSRMSLRRQQSSTALQPTASSLAQRRPTTPLR